MSCETKNSLSPFLDGELPDKERAAVETHLDECGQCRKDVEGLRAVAALLKALPERPLPQGFSRRLEDRRLAPLNSEAPAGGYRGALAFVCAAAAFAVYRAATAPAPVPPPPAKAPAAAVAAAPGAPIAPVTDAAPPPPAQKAAPQEELTNEVLYERMKTQAQTMGIKSMSAPGESDADLAASAGAGEGPTNRTETRLYTERLAALRRSMGLVEPISVRVEGNTSILLASEDGAGGAPLRTGAERRSAAGAAEPVAGALEHGWAGRYGGGNEAGTQTVSDAAAWKKLWKSVSLSQTPPVDFSRSEVVAVFLGPRPSGGFGVEISEVKATESFVLVRYKETAPPPGRTPMEGLTSPFVMRVIDRSSLPVRFEAVKE